MIKFWHVLFKNKIVRIRLLGSKWNFAFVRSEQYEMYMSAAFGMTSLGYFRFLSTHGMKI